MPMRVTSTDLEELGGKLDALGNTLSEGDRDLLAAIFALAGKQVADNLRDDEVSGFAFRQGGFALAPLKGGLAPGLRDNFFKSMPTAPGGLGDAPTIIVID